MTTQEKIAKLHPAIRGMAQQLIDQAKAKLGIDLRIVQGLRTFDEQDKLYNQQHDGIDNDGNGIIDDAREHVTNAKAGQSFHNYGLAIDVCPFKKDGTPDWESKLWEKIAEIGKAIGFSWGGEWQGKLKDKPHFEFPKNTKYTVLLALKKAGKVDKDGYVILK